MSSSGEDVMVTSRMRECSKVMMMMMMMMTMRKIMVTHGYQSVITHLNVHYILSPLELANSRTCQVVYITRDNDYLQKFICMQNDCLLGCMFTAVRTPSACAYQHFQHIFRNVQLLVGNLISFQGLYKRKQNPGFLLH